MHIDILKMANNSTEWLYDRAFVCSFKTGFWKSVALPMIDGVGHNTIT